MTISIAALKNGVVVIGSDTLESQAGIKAYETKLIKIKDCYVSTCGLSNVQRIIEGLSRSNDWCEAFKIDDVQDAQMFGQEIFDILNEQTKKWPPDSDDMVEEILVATPTKVFRISRWGVAWEIKEFCCIGSGSSFAYGALKKSWIKESRNLKKLVSEALEIACFFSTSCGGDIEVKTVS